jgi:hypothetical protein
MKSPIFIVLLLLPLSCFSQIDRLQNAACDAYIGELTFRLGNAVVVNNSGIDIIYYYSLDNSNWSQSTLANGYQHTWQLNSSNIGYIQINTANRPPVVYNITNKEYYFSFNSENTRWELYEAKR